MNEFSLTSLLQSQREPDQLVAFDGNKTIAWRQWKQDVVRVSSALVQIQASTCAVYTASPYWCAVATVVSLLCGKTVLLLPGMQKCMLQALDAQTVLLLDESTASIHDVPVPCLDLKTVAGDQAQDAPAVKVDDGAIVALFTSGSSGQPVRIDKTLANFESEVNCLESMWGSRLQGAAVMATVSHQHIYGFLFCVLWPLLSGRPLYDGIIEYPEQLTLFGIQASVLVSSPAFLKRITGQKQLELPGLVFSSGGPLDPQVNRLLRAMTGTTLIEVFGSTETGGVASRDLLLDEAWTLMPGVQAVQCDDGLSINSRHCLEGAFTMSDRCHWLDEQRFALLGRGDRIVKLEEKRVSLLQIETRLLAETSVSECHALVLNGKRDLLCLAVVLSDDGARQRINVGDRSIKQQIKAWLLDVVEPVALPRRIRFMDNLPLTAQGKVDRIELESHFYV